MSRRPSGRSPGLPYRREGGGEQESVPMSNKASPHGCEFMVDEAQQGRRRRRPTQMLALGMTSGNFGPGETGMAATVL